MAKSVSFTLNGHKEHVAVDDPNEPLLYVLRDQFNLDGPKFGCGLAQCNACAVLFDGVSVPSCQYPIGSVEGATVTTVEGLGNERKPHPVQAAFIAEQAAQCGYCTSGMIVSAAALLKKTPHPTDAQIKTALEGNLCRCASHFAYRARRQTRGRGRDENRMSTTLDRSTFLKQSGGALVVGFTLSAPAFAQTAAPQATVNPTLVGAGSNAVDAWLAVDRAGLVTVYSGKVELGTGTETALLQLVADELSVPFATVRMIAGITGVTPDQGVTSGSQTIMTGPTPMRRAPATARMQLIQLAAQRFQVASADLVTRDGYVMPRDGDRSRAVGYGELVGDRKFDLTVNPQTPLMSPSSFRVVGQPVKRVDFPEKAYGTFKYTQNVRLPGMWHARVLRPDPVGATFVSLDRSAIAAIPNVRIVQKGNFVAVAAPKEWDAIRAARAQKVTWSGGGLPAQNDLHDIIRKTPADVKVAAQTGDADAALANATKKLTASYYWPFQTHGSIGPSCGVAQVNPDGTISVWNGTQGVYQMRDAIAQLVNVSKESIKLNYVEASGCYGHNGADDSGTDAVLVAQAIGKPVRVQWSRADEHGWDPKGPAMVMDTGRCGRPRRDGDGAGYSTAIRRRTRPARPV